MASVMLAAFVAVGERIRQFDANLTVLDQVDDLLGLAGRPERKATTEAEAAPGDPFGGQAVNILLTAIDSRDGDNAGTVYEHLSSNPERYRELLNDVNMVAHISADRQRVDIVAIPRDTLITLPDCSRPDGTTAWGYNRAQINWAFNHAANSDPAAKNEGVACVMQAVESITGIYLDTFILVDFAGFANVVDGLGGVDICVPEGLVGRDSKVELEPGQHHLDGRTALAYARTRTGKTATGKALDGADTTRISRQQELIATVINEVMDSGNLQSIGKLNATATAVTKSLYVGDELGSVGALAGLAYALRNIELANVSLFTAPWVQDLYDRNRVQLAEWGQGDRFGGLSAEGVFEVIGRDEAVPGTVPYKLAHPEDLSDADQSGWPDPSDPSAQEGGSAGDPGAVDAAGGAEPETSATPSADDEFVTPLTAPVTCQMAGQGSSGG
jgi:LCP family protein required for cell wall assembly